MGASNKIGILLLDIGEPPEYTKHTYYSFRDYAEALVDIGIVDRRFLESDRGTVLRDVGSLMYDGGFKDDAFIDAWLKEYKGKASKTRKPIDLPDIFSEHIDSYRFQRKEGPGNGEPDLYEMYGFEVLRSWQMMGGRSPYHGMTLGIKNSVKEMLERKYGKRIAVRFAYGMDPTPDEKKQTPDVAVKELVKKEKITHLLAAEHINVFSDVTNDLYLRKKVVNALDALDSRIPVSYSNQLGENEALTMGVAEKVSDELRIIPEKSNVMIGLSHQGVPPVKVGEYDSVKDSYHENSKRVFEAAKRKIKEIKKRGRLEVVQVFARQTMGEGEDAHKILTPHRALDMAVSKKFNYYIDIPYEFPADGVHVLVKLRHAYMIDPPRWNSVYETNFPYKSLKAKIASAYFYPEYRTRAYYLEIEKVLEGLL